MQGCGVERNVVIYRDFFGDMWCNIWGKNGKREIYGIVV